MRTIGTTQTYMTRGGDMWPKVRREAKEEKST